ncbi:hypothetical protein C8J57DRAFT_1250133 [Mycena rebaudengoi]|nr:hypothetical protein C8J57DRAFT_1250133 [Mycena rebaudengoi]
MSDRFLPIGQNGRSGDLIRTTDRTEWWQLFGQKSNDLTIFFPDVPAISCIRNVHNDWIAAQAQQKLGKEHTNLDQDRTLMKIGQSGNFTFLPIGFTLCAMGRAQLGNAVYPAVYAGGSGTWNTPGGNRGGHRAVLAP